MTFKQLKIKEIIILLILSSSFYTGNAQFHARRTQELKANSNWFFGQYGMDMNQDPPEVTNTSDFQNVYDPYEMFANAPYETQMPGMRYSNVVPVSHPLTGAFRFLALTDKVFDRNFNLMLNGAFNPETFDPTSLSKMIAVAPLINDTNRYYFFNLSGIAGLTYSIVDMRLNNGLGAIDPAAKAIVVKTLEFPESMPEIIDVVPGNNCDYWILVAENSGSISKFRVYAMHVTETGISTSAVTSTLEKDYQSQVFWDYQVSPDREGIAFVALKPDKDTVTDKASNIYFYKFDPETGIVSKSTLPKIDVPLRDIGVDVHGSFTPDNRYYVVSNNDYRDKQIYLTKYDLSAPGSNYNPVEFSFPLDYWTLSAKLKGCPSVPPTIFFKAYDNTLFFNIPLSHRGNCLGGNYKVFTNDVGSMGSILPGATGWGQTAFGPPTLLSPRNRFFTSVPVVYPYTAADTLPSVYQDSVFCFDPEIPFQQVTLQARAGFSNYVWDNGTPGETRTITEPGKYWVYYTGPCNTRVDTFVFRFRERKQILGPDTEICEQRFPVDISALESGHYFWDDKSMEQNRRIYRPGIYSITFEAYGCRQFDSISITSMVCPCNISVPNAFSPNNDGLNDYYKPTIALGCVPSQYSLRVYNRWGQLMYKSNDEFDKGWDGTYGSNTADPGTYFYELRFKTQARKEGYYNKGELTLIR
jgi:gliding motility-associated-like protein